MGGLLVAIFMEVLGFWDFGISEFPGKLDRSIPSRPSSWEVVNPLVAIFVEVLEFGDFGFHGNLGRSKWGIESQYTAFVPWWNIADC